LFVEGGIENRRVRQKCRKHFREAEPLPRTARAMEP
jgi:hypothetical protein